MKTLENTWKKLVDHSPMGIYRAEMKTGRFIFVNRAFVKIFGFDSSEVFLKEVPFFYNILQGTADWKKIRTVMERQGVVKGIELQARSGNGQAIWIDLNASKVEEAFGKSVSEGFIRDISERKFAEASLQASENRFQMLVEQAGDAFFIHDYTGKILDVNRRACESLGYARDDLLSMRISDIDIEIHEKQHKPRFWEQLASGEFVTFEGLQERKDGSVFPVEVRLGRLDLDGQKLLLSLTRDVTERKRAENKLKHAFAEITELKNQLEKENVHLKRVIELKHRHEKIVGESPAIKRVLHQIEAVAKKESIILIEGETGTGKELLARAIHNISLRKGLPMITVNCAALAPTLIESELFGREKGAFTGAISRQAGRFEMAHQSTLFLDEIGDLSLELQAKLLRVLQDGRFERIGSSETISVDVRVIAATNQDLADLVEEKKFRRDLYYRLNVFPITVPPLRDRKDDIPLLVWSFVREFEQSMGKTVKSIPQKTMEFLQGYSWPGNIRELRNVIERAMILSTGQILIIDRFDESKRADDKRIKLAEIERKHILRTLEGTGWRISGKNGAASILGLKESTLRSRMKKIGIRRPT